MPKFTALQLNHAAGIKHGGREIRVPAEGGVVREHNNFGKSGAWVRAWVWVDNDEVADLIDKGKGD
jgi:hypothetical protein